jgi:hypothetical protein
MPDILDSEYDDTISDHELAPDNDHARGEVQDEPHINDGRDAIPSNI